MGVTRILLVADEQLTARNLQSSLKQLGYDSGHVVSSGEEALQEAEDTYPDLILMDILPAGNLDGIETARRIRSRHDIPVVFLTDYAHRNVVHRAQMAEPYSYLIKPVQTEDLRTAIQTALNRHGVERRCKEIGETYRCVFDPSLDAIGIVRGQGQFVYVNASFCDLFGYSQEEIRTTNARDLWADKVERSRFVETLKADGFVEGLQWTIRRKDGDLRRCLLSSTLQRTDDGSLICHSITRDLGEPINDETVVHGVQSDLERLLKERTAELEAANERLEQELARREQTERVLLESRQSYKDLYERSKAAEEIYRSLLASTPDAAVVYDMEGRAQYVNDSFTRMFGWSRDEVIGAPLDFVPDSQREPTMAVLQSVVEGGIPCSGLETKRLTRDGRLLDVHISGARYHDTEGRPAGLFVMIRDISERKRAESDLRQSEEKYRTIIENIEEGYYEIDHEGYMVFCNESLAKILGYTRTELIGMNCSELVEEGGVGAMFDNLKGVAETGRSSEVSGWELIRKDGAKKLIEASVSLIRSGDGGPCGFRGIIRDITRRKSLEDRLYQAQKMEAIGTLAGGIAHDFNNILYAIMGYTELALDDAAVESRLHSNLKQVLGATNRAKDLVKQVLTFSRQQEQARRPTQIASIAKETVKFLRASIPSTIEILLSIGSQLGMVMADPTQMHRVLMNLCTNAAHAMREKGGTMTVILDQVQIGSEYDSRHLEVLPGTYQRITVSDKGHGMTPEVTERIFEPYFTTKEPGEGTGLGLAVVHGIVKSHEGTITVYSEPGLGSSFSVYLPVIERSTRSEHVFPEVPKTGNERILLVDDELAIVQIGKQMLERLGYRVEIRTSSIEALELFRVRSGEFDLVITDLTMPNMIGTDLAMELMKIRKNIPVILCTGFSELITEERALAMGIRALMAKPILKKKMAETVRRVLDLNTEQEV